MAVNKYPGLCGTCAGSVPAGTGWLTKANGRWITYHSQCIPTPCAPEAGDHDGWHRRLLAAFDVETTGVRHSVDRIVSACVRDTDGHSLELLIDPGVDIPVEATATHGITTAHARLHGQPPAHALDILADALAAHARSSTPIVIYNAVYDLTLLESELLRYGLRPLVDRTHGYLPVVIDPLVLDRHVDPYRAGGRSLQAVCAFYDVTHPGPHHADADTRACLDVAIAIAARHPALAALSPADVHTQQTQWYADYICSLADRYPHRLLDPRWPVAHIAADPWPVV